MVINVSINIRNWTTTEEEQILLGGLGIQVAVFEPQFTGPDRTVFTEKLKKRLRQQGPHGCCRASTAWLNPLVRPGLYE